MVGLILLGVMFLLAALNLPIAFAIGFACLAGMLYIGDIPVAVAAQRMVVGPG